MALKCLVWQLGHQYPKVRTYTAQQLYVPMVSDMHVVGSMTVEQEEYEKEDGTSSPLTSRHHCAFVPTEAALQEVLDLLTSTHWEGDDLNGLRVVRRRICALMYMKVKIGNGSKAQKATSSTSGGSKVDELDSYESLVRVAGTTPVLLSYIKCCDVYLLNEVILCYILQLNIRRRRGWFLMLFPNV